MKEKKNIERLFQESFKDFEITPHDKNWEAIQNRLDGKEKNKKFIPIWFRYASVAAIFLLFLALGSRFFFDSNNKLPVNKVAIESDTVLDSDIENISAETLENTVVNTNTLDTKTNASKVENTLEQSNQEANSDEASSGSDLNNTLFAPQNKNVDNLGVAPNRNNSSTSEGNSKIGSNSIGQPSNSIAKSTEKRKKNNSLFDNPVNKNKSAYTDSNSIEKGKIAFNDNSKKQEKSIARELNQEVDQTNEKKALEKNTLPESGIASADIASKSVEKEEMDSLTEIQKDSLVIEEAIAKSEDKDIDEEEKLVNRWQLYANVAPVYYNTLSEGSHLHEQFVNSPKSGEFNASYGINVGYALNHKLTVRTGVKSLDLSYSTGNVILYESPGNSSVQTMLRNVTMANDSISHMAVLSSDNFLAREANSGILSSDINGTLTQNISYFEVPVEVEYNLINKKIGFQVIGGLSTFFLNNNEIFANIQGTRNYIGKANNINNVSFSANFGLGLDYNFSQKFKFNLEPTFKYQLNAYNNTSGNFRPYIIGVYTGFSYKF